ncbi:MAG: sulfurtransferase [Planctomycetota bacterium]|nr:MAG: sulfurtransferase [Planctomycetota bacterium]
MYGPVAKIFQWSLETQFFWAFIIGLGFGFFLESAGFGNSRKLALQFYFRDMTVLKVMFTAIVTAMIGLVYLTHLGFLDYDLIYLNPTYVWPGLVGGLIMGVGFIIGGYCPGTSFAGLATLKMDALFYLLGALIGMVLFGEVYPYIADFMHSGFLGKRYTLDQWLHLPTKVVAFIVLLIAIGAFWAAEWAEKKFGEEDSKEVPQKSEGE